MEVDYRIANLISDMEWKFTDSIWNNYSKQWIRYPVKMQLSHTGEWMEFNGLVPCADQKEVDSMFYKFGYNELQIGMALTNMLEFLENRYGLNFNELENKKWDEAHKDDEEQV